MVKNRSMLWWTALLIGWSFDLLYWGKAPGISFGIQITLILTTLLVFTHREGKSPAGSSLPLAGLALIFSILAFLRAEPFTRVLNHLFAVGYLGLFILVYQSGRWQTFRPVDYLVGAFRLLIQSIALPIQQISSAGENPEDEEQSSQQKPGRWKRIAPYLRGLLLALPVLAVLSALLAEADPIFSRWLEDFIAYFRLEKLPEYILRAVLIGIWTLLAAGWMLFARRKSAENPTEKGLKNWPPRFLGFTESAVILGSVDLLFLVFVSIQFRYFFGGEKNISLEGFTYAEYARRGFGELLLVAFLTLGLMIVLSTVVRKQGRTQTALYSGLSGLMTGFIGVILVSSHNRLALYEAAYGFTRLRMYSHLCILWIGILFAAVLILEISQRQKYFTLAALLAVTGFTLTMNAVNIDGLISRRNVSRAGTSDAALDTHYLKTLSDDAVPALVSGLREGGLSDTEGQQLAAVLACREQELEEQDRRWQSFLFPTWRAERILEKEAGQWKDILLMVTGDGSWVAELEEGEFYCGYYAFD